MRDGGVDGAFEHGHSPFVPANDANSPTSPRRVRARVHDLQAFELRKMGATYREIGKQLGITKQAANVAIKRVLAETIAQTMESVEEVRCLEVERLDRLLLGIWDKARNGDEHAVGCALKIMSRRAELLGLDAPRRTDIGSDPNRPLRIAGARGLTDEELEAIVLAAATKGAK